MIRSPRCSRFVHVTQASLLSSSASILNHTLCGIPVLQHGWTPNSELQVRRRSLRRIERAILLIFVPFRKNQHNSGMGIILREIRSIIAIHYRHSCIIVVNVFALPSGNLRWLHVIIRHCSFPAITLPQRAEKYVVALTMIRLPNLPDLQDDLVTQSKHSAFSQYLSLTAEPTFPLFLFASISLCASATFFQSYTSCTDTCMSPLTIIGNASFSNLPRSSPWYSGERERSVVPRMVSRLKRSGAKEALSGRVAPERNARMIIRPS